ncbi:hypothetical protein ONE63_000095 [Megalurothrips usitatus]|uniref:Uncharacterized protein n=1 Tax=Megalurothrips usitatus TaxID=439358 RepID=A0AAV7Y193_9NEOP|nr:hypothetical protein ONE63_000095 [Megalurothrips usitatus]
MFINPNVSQIRTASGEYYVSGSFNISRASRVVTKAIVTLDYCSQNVGKRCEHFQTWRYGSDSCSLWQSKNTIWTQFVDSVQPRYTCPFQAVVGPEPYTCEEEVKD